MTGESIVPREESTTTVVLLNRHTVKLLSQYLCTHGLMQLSIFIIEAFLLQCVVVKTEIHTWSKHGQQMTMECLGLNGTAISSPKGSRNISEDEVEGI